MNIIIPMAGLGKRLRPHTLTIPKPLLPIAGKPIVHRLVEDIAKVCPEKIDEIGFIIHPSFGKEVEESLKGIAAEVGATGSIFYQTEALGISHALLFAKELFKGKVIVAFADTLFKADFRLDTSKDGIIWVQQVDDPSQFGVVRLNDKNEIIEFVEKPSTFVSDLAIIGIYFFKNGEALAAEMQYLIDNDIKEKGEYQFTTALQNLNKKGAKFTPGRVSEWLDCGNKNVTVQTNQRYLEFIKGEKLVSPKARLNNAVIIPPCFVGDEAVIENSVVGPYVSIGRNSHIKDSRIINSIIQTNSKVSQAVLENSMLGNFVNFEARPLDLSVGDFNTIT
ncbi:nucleotidyltransferase [Fulvivirgaceae bacterium PWU4]|uniref:Nucleotidyltransferase n=1 Tax=Chryseosolibacter histidini TaxID=2782349 RepID=A0AAP2DSU5_9BACT|nr:sugar phosphate nucleotidyltransferase [Chryseosolibacter histidini]MBT1700577.1 nucleotidyltransferase [Chryseosolibacter histidini]